MRNANLDGLKFFLIFLVVFGHIDYAGRDVLYRIIYSFHMPLFLAVSGYCTSIKSWDNTLKSVGRIFRVYVLFAFIILIRTYYRNDKCLPEDFWITPPLWYLEVIMLYRIVIKAINGRLNLLSWRAVLCSFIVGFLIGFVPFDFFAFQRIFAFFPFFHLGYCYKHNASMFKALIDKLDNGDNNRVIIGLSFIVVGILLAIYSPSPFIPKYHYQGLKGVLGCIYKYFGAIVMSIGLLVLLYKKMHVMSEWGRYTLQIYVLHGFVLSLIYLIQAGLGLETNFFLALLYTVIVIVVIVQLSKLRISKYLFE